MSASTTPALSKMAEQNKTKPYQYAKSFEVASLWDYLFLSLKT